MKAGLLALGMLLACTSLAADQASTAECQATDTTRALCAAEAALTEALQRNDAARLSELYAEEFELINYRGGRVDRAAVLAALRSGALRFDSLATSELQVRVYGATGVLTGIQHQVAREPGDADKAHPKEVRFTHLYLLREGRWRLVASQITPILSAPRRP